MIAYDQQICHNLDAACTREWLETNGIGGFASSTIIGLNTRRYHGLLTAATKPPLGRVLLLSKLEETLILDGRRFELSANQYPGVIHPQGYRYVRHFRLDPFPIFTYDVDGTEIEKCVFMIHGENSTVIHYSLKSEHQRAALLEVRPLIAFRDYHSTTHENPTLDATLHSEPHEVRLTPYPGLPTLYLAHDGDMVESQECWYQAFEYAVERECGLDWVEDLFNPYTLQFDLGRRAQAAVIASTAHHEIDHVTDYRRAETGRRAAVQATAPIDTPSSARSPRRPTSLSWHVAPDSRSSLAIIGSATKGTRKRMTREPCRSFRASIVSSGMKQPAASTT